MRLALLMKIFKTIYGPVVEREGCYYRLTELDWDALINQDDPRANIEHHVKNLAAAGEIDQPLAEHLLAPIGTQEVWAAGVTYFRSRDARVEESSDSGGGDFYERVYDAPRPELFFKASPHRVVGPHQPVRIREDSAWNVPEPELTLVVNSKGHIVGYCIGNDMSSRDIEGQNPLYLPQAKIYDQCCALGPGILLSDEPLPPSTEIRLAIHRQNQILFSGSTQLEQMKRRPDELVDYLFKCNSFPTGCFLMTGTGIVPPTSFTLESGDEIAITIEPIGSMVNVVQ